MKTYTVYTFGKEEIHCEQVPLPAPEPFALGRSWLYWPVMGAMLAFIVLTIYALLAGGAK